MPVTVVPTSLATVAIDTFITELSSVMRNCPAASVSRTAPAAPARSPVEAPTAATLGVPVWTPRLRHRHPAPPGSSGRAPSYQRPRRPQAGFRLAQPAADFLPQAR